MKKGFYRLKKLLIVFLYRSTHGKRNYITHLKKMKIKIKCVIHRNNSELGKGLYKSLESGFKQQLACLLSKLESANLLFNDLNHELMYFNRAGNIQNRFCHEIRASLKLKMFIDLKSFFYIDYKIKG
jgi:hypothetical protein